MIYEKCFILILKKDRGEVWLGGELINFIQPKDAIEKGLIYIAEDRRNESILPNMNVRENMTISNLNSYSGIGFLKRKREIDDTEKMVKGISIKTKSVENNIMNLSGDNQQKVVITRSILLKPKVLFLDEITHGIDVGAKSEVHMLIKN